VNADAGSASGASGGVAIANVLANDTLVGAQANTVASSAAAVTLDTATGAVLVAQGAANGADTATATVELSGKGYPTR
jgi:hypothetical protein